MIEKPLVSIVVPIYNVSPYLDRCLESIVGQTHDNLEIVCVDDGSTDESGEILDAWSNKDRRIVALHKANSGLSDARNLGISHSTGEYLSCVDSDDFVSPHYVEYLLGLFSHSDACRMVGCGHLVLHDGGRIRTHGDKSDAIHVFDRKGAYQSVLCRGKVNVSAWAKLYHKSLKPYLKYPSQRIYEDTFIFSGLLDHCGEYVFGEKQLYFYNKHADSITGGGFDERSLQFIDSVEVLCNAAEHYDSELHVYCGRRRVHARLSVLRLMKGCDASQNATRDALREYVIKNRSLILNSSSALRDKLAILALMAGYGPFFRALDAYEKLSSLYR